jgi:hypothetical protein
MICNTTSLQTFSDSPVTCDLTAIFHARHRIICFSPSHFLSSPFNLRKRSEAVYTITSLFLGALHQVDGHLLAHYFDITIIMCASPLP